MPCLTYSFTFLLMSSEGLKFRCCSDYDGKGAPEWFPDPDTWKEPKLGCTEDPEKLARRKKDLKKGFESQAYKMYTAEIAK